MRIIFATGNSNKMKEIREIYGDLGKEILSIKEAKIPDTAEENGTTFEENALIKARSAARYCDDLVMADDSGLEIDYLNKQPGIYSARFMGHDTAYTLKNQALLDKLKGVPKEKRTARFVCAIAAVFPDKSELVIKRTMEGYISEKMAGVNGFGYDPIFWLKEYGCTSAELSAEQKNEISHRGKALRAMKEELVKNAYFNCK